MNRARRSTGTKAFVSGGVYNPNAIVQPVIQMVAAPVAPPDAAVAVAAPIPAKVHIVEAPPVVSTISIEAMQTETLTTNDGQVPSEIMADNNNGGKIPFKQIFQNRKKSSERMREKKLRQNRQLRKSMLPKNALMALNEVKGITISEFAIDSNVDGGFTALVTVNSNQYEGKGNSKMAAKNLACEKALRDYIISKMTPKPTKKSNNPSHTSTITTTTTTETETATTTPTMSSGYSHGHGLTMDIDDIDGGGDGGDGDENPEDELPMLNLASFAIYKLFSEWEKDGFLVPEMHPTGNNNNNSSSSPPQTDNNSTTSNTTPAPAPEPKKPIVRTELPANWQSMHPATLLCIMRPGISYIDYGSTGEQPNILQRFGIIVDNQEFTANGRSKKIARRNVAVNVCNTLFNTTFTYEEY